tara:strand:- start:478 stop:915 length:438 start_codon:yes stop_codon:yes gene_type:complete
MNDTNLFLLLNFIIGFYSDILINILTKNNISYLKSLKPYFNNKSVLKAALYAGITVLIIVYIIMKIYDYYYDKELPESKKEYLIYLLLTFIVGFISDIIINRINLFPKLKTYYKNVGEGLWGGIAILFSVILSLIMLFIHKLMFV